MEIASPSSTSSIRRGPAQKLKSKKCIVIVAVLTSVLCVAIVASVLLVWYLKSAKGESNSIDGKKICRTPNCIAAAVTIKSNMNLSADPCNDFFNYVCGGWLEKNKDVKNQDLSLYFSLEKQIKSELHKELMDPRESESKAVNHAKNLYQACIDTSTQQLKIGFMKVLRKIGGFPLYIRGRYDKKIKWFERLAIMYREFVRVGPYISEDFSWWFLFPISVESKNKGVVFLKVLPVSSLPRAEFAINDTYKDRVYRHMCNRMTPICTSKESTSMKKQIVEMVTFLASLVQIASRFKDELTVSAKPFAEFYSRFPELHIPTIMKTLFRPLKLNAQSYSDMRIAITNNRYFEELVKLINITKPETIDNAIGWYIIQHINFLNMERETDERRNWCMEEMNNVFPFVVGRIFVDMHYDRETKSSLAAKTYQMKEVFIDTINNNTWLDVEDKKYLIGKLEVLDINIGFPEWIKIDRFLDEFHSRKIYLKNQTMVENLHRFHAANTYDYIKIYRLPPLTRDFRWLNYLLQEMNANYFRTENKVIFPISQYYSTEMYWPKTIKALEYSGSMSIMGHEMGHTIDDNGITFDATGKVIKLNEKLSQKFNERVNCFKKQYSSIFDPEAKMNLDGSKTSGEDIGDCVSLRLVFDTYVRNRPEDVRLPGLENISDKQLLFISSFMSRCSRKSPEKLKNQIMDGVHSLDRYRIIVPALNFPEFAKAFHCSESSYMNSKDRCVLW